MLFTNTMHQLLRDDTSFKYIAAKNILPFVRVWWILVSGLFISKLMNANYGTYLRFDTVVFFYLTSKKQI